MIWFVSCLLFLITVEKPGSRWNDVLMMTWLVRERGKNSGNWKVDSQLLIFITYSWNTSWLTTKRCKNSTGVHLLSSSSVVYLRQPWIYQNAYINITTILLTIDFRFHQFFHPSSFAVSDRSLRYHIALLYLLTTLHLTLCFNLFRFSLSSETVMN